MGLVYIKDWSQDMIRVPYHVFILPERALASVCIVSDETIIRTKVM